MDTGDAEDEERIAARLSVTGPLGRVMAWLGGTVFSPLMRFDMEVEEMRSASRCMDFVLLFNIGEAFMERMSRAWYGEIGVPPSPT